MSQRPVRAARGGALVPGMAVLVGYERSWLRGDLLAGVTVAAYLVPQVMAYAGVAGLPPVAGLWAILPALALYALLGSSRLLSVGPESTTALMTAAVVGPLAAGDPGRYAVAGGRARRRGRAAVPGGVGGAAGLRRRSAVPAGPDRLSGGRGADHDRGPAAQAHRRPDDGLRLLPPAVRPSYGTCRRLHPATVVFAAAALVFLFTAARGMPAPCPARCWPWCSARPPWRPSTSRTDGITVIGEVPAGLPRPDAAGPGRAAAPAAARARRPPRRLHRLHPHRAGLRRHDDERPAAGRQPGVPGPGRGEPRRRRAARLPGEQQRQPHRARRLGGRPQPGVLAGRRRGRARRAALPQPAAGATRPSAVLGALVVYAAVRMIDLAGFRRLASFRRRELLLALGCLAGVLALDILYGVLVAVGLSVAELLTPGGPAARRRRGPGARRGRHARRGRLSAGPHHPRAAGLPLRLPAVLRQRRGLPPPRPGRRRRTGRARSAGSSSTPRPTWRWTSPPWTRSTRCAAN